MGGIADVSRWPWTWVRVYTHIRQIKSVYERAAYDKDPKTALPPRWMFWDAAALDQWFEDRKQDGSP